MASGAILPAPAVPASTRISARLKHVWEHSSPVNVLRVMVWSDRWIRSRTYATTTYSFYTSAAHSTGYVTEHAKHYTRRTAPCTLHTAHGTRHTALASESVSPELSSARHVASDELLCCRPAVRRFVCGRKPWPRRSLRCSRASRVRARPVRGPRRVCCCVRARARVCVVCVCVFCVCVS